jgi:HAE1 family hydrophobic/amphiphilic exporter-1
MILSDVSIKRPVFATMINLVLIVFGLFSYGKIGIDQFPNVDFPIVTVQTVYKGADPKTIEQKVLDPLEKGLNGLEGLESITSVAYPNLGQIILQFKLERNGDRAAQDARDKVGTLLSQLPAEADTPVVAKFDVGGAPILTMTLSAEESALSYAELSRLAKDSVKPALEQVAGVGRVDIAGQREREIQVRVLRSRLQSFGLAPINVAQAIASQNIDIPSGRVDNGTELLRISTLGTLRTAAEIGQIMIPMRSGQKIRVEDVAEVKDTLADEEGAAAANGKTAIVLAVYKQSGGNAVAIANGAREKIEDLKTRLPKGVNFQIFQDNSIYIKGSIDSVKFDLVLGALLAIFIVMLFLHDWRATFISACAIPTSVIATFFFIEYMGFTLNVMTTLGLTLSIGILVDDAIVVIENIHRRLELGESPIEAAKNGTAEIGLAALAITLSIVAVFVPVAFMEGIIGRFFFQFGLTVAFAVLISLFVAFTLTPMMSARLLRAHEAKPKFFVPIEAVLKSIEARYKATLEFALKRRWLTVFGGVVILAISILMLTKVPVSFFPKEDRSQLFVNLEYPEGTPLSLTKQRSARIDDYLRSYPGIQDVVMSIGASAERKPNLTRFDINLVPKEDRTFSQSDLINRLRDDLKLRFNADSEKFEVNEAGGGGGGRAQPIQLILVGNDFEALSAFSKETQKWISENVPGAVDVVTTEPPKVTEVKVVTDPVRSADVGISTAQIGSSLRSLFEGEKLGEIEDKGKRYDVRLKVDDLDKRSIEDVSAISIPNANGASIALSSVAQIFRGETVSKVERRGGQRQIMVLANFTGEDLNKAVSSIETHVRSTLPPGISLTFEGQAKILKEAVASMLSALLLAVLLVFMVLCAQFESYLTPFVIMMSVPLAFSGAFAGLLLTQKAMSVYAMIGLIMLIGLVTKNAILLIDFTLIRMRTGMSVHDALVEAGPIRLRPILMTTAAMIGGMIPIAIGHGVGGEARAPMAVCVIGGLISSTLLTLVVVPCVFSLIEDFKHWLSSRRKVSIVESH